MARPDGVGVISGLRVSGVLLAAGGSSRFGGPLPKQLVGWRGEPLVRVVARRLLASRLADLVVVVGHRAEAVRQALEGLALRTVEARRWRDGQSASVRAGLEAIDGDAAAALFVPCDQPLLTPDLIDRLVARFAETGGPIVAPTHGGRRAAPVLFARALFPELARISGDSGGRQLFADHAVVELEVAEPDPLRDFDTPEELAALRRHRPAE